MAMDHRGYLRRISALYALYGALPTTWQLAILGALSTVGTFLGYYTGDPFKAFVGLMTGFGLGSMGLFFTQTILRNATVFSKVGVGGMGISSVGADIKANIVREFTGITMNFAIQNTGSRDIFFRILRSDLSILNTVNQDAKEPEGLHLIPVGFPQLFNLATIQHIKVPSYRPNEVSPVTGKLKLELVYGSKKTNLSYLFTYEADLVFGWTVPTGKNSNQQANVFVGNSITKNEHTVYYGK